MTMKILWGITGCGDKLEETISIMQELQKKHNLDVTIALSKNGKICVNMYNIWQSLQDISKKIFVERGPNTPFLVGPLQKGKYDFFIICPATANTTAKIAHGIADSLISNCASQAIKAGIKVHIYPADQKRGKIDTILPGGKKLTLTMREIDLENTERLKRMKGITVIPELEEIEKMIKNVAT
jgi:archaeoflavoprotein AfpA